MENYIHFIKTHSRIEKHMDIVDLIQVIIEVLFWFNGEQERIQTSIKQERYDTSAEFTKLLKTFQTLDLTGFQTSKPMNLIQNDVKSIINFINEILLDVSFSPSPNSFLNFFRNILLEENIRNILIS